MLLSHNGFNDAARPSEFKDVKGEEISLESAYMKEILRLLRNHMNYILTARDINAYHLTCEDAS